MNLPDDHLNLEVEPPPSDTVNLFVELEEKDVHFLDTIIKGYNGIANVRRDYKVREGKIYFKILVSPDLLEESKQVLEELREYISIGEIREEL